MTPQFKRRFSFRAFSGRRVISILLTVSFALSPAGSLPGGPGASLAYGQSLPAAAASPEPESLVVPENLGRIQEIHYGTGTNRVYIIQDAHALPQAQISVAGLLEYLIHDAGVRQVLTEGAGQSLDLQLLRFFPDRAAAESLLRERVLAGELSGVMLAALQAPENIPFSGLENQDVYDAAVKDYLKARMEAPEFNKRFEILEASLEAAKEKIFSKELRELDRRLQNFYSHGEGLGELLVFLERIQSFSGKPHLEAVLKGLHSRDPGEQAARNALLENAVHDLDLELKDPAGLRQLHDRTQRYHLSELDDRSFGAFLADEGNSLGWPAARLKLLRDSETQVYLSELQPPVFFQELENLLKEIKETLFDSPEARAIDRISGKVSEVSKLLKMELIRPEWDRLQSFAAARGPVESGVDHEVSALEESVRIFVEDLFNQGASCVKFYQKAALRDSLFSKKILQALEDSQGPVAVLAGGYHAQGLLELLGAAEVTVVLIAPSMKEMPAADYYSSAMKGEVSWSHELRVRNGRVDIHEAFVRDAVKQLLALRPGEAGKEVRRWRDQGLRELAAAGRIVEAVEILKPLKSISPDESGIVPARLEQFLGSLEQLTVQNRLTPDQLVSLFRGVSLMPFLHVPAPGSRDAEILLLVSRWRNLEQQGASPFVEMTNTAAESRDELRVGADPFPEGAVWLSTRGEFASNLVRILVEDFAGIDEVRLENAWQPFGQGVPFLNRLRFEIAKDKAVDLPQTARTPHERHEAAIDLAFQLLHSLPAAGHFEIRRLYKEKADGRPYAVLQVTGLFRLRSWLKENVFHRQSGLSQAVREELDKLAFRLQHEMEIRVDKTFGVSLYGLQVLLRKVLVRAVETRSIDEDIKHAYDRRFFNAFNEVRIWIEHYHRARDSGQDMETWREIMPRIHVIEEAFEEGRLLVTSLWEHAELWVSEDTAGGARSLTNTLEVFDGWLGKLERASYAMVRAYNILPQSEYLPLPQSARRRPELRSPQISETPGALDGTILISYANTYATSGGLSSHLENLNRELVRRHKVTIYQFYPSRGRERVQEPLTEQYERGRIIYMPLAREEAPSFAAGEAPGSAADTGPALVDRLISLVRRAVLFVTRGNDNLMALVRNSVNALRDLIYHPAFTSLTRYLPGRPGRQVRESIRLSLQFSTALDRILQEAGSSPVIFVHHSPDSADSLGITAAAAKRHLVSALEYHGGDIPRRILFRVMREFLKNTSGVQVDGLENLLGDRAETLGNGIDVQFYNPDLPEVAAEKGTFRRGLEIRADQKMIIVPARVTKDKGGDVVLETARLLRDEYGHRDFVMVFVGDQRPENAAFHRQLAEQIARDHLEEFVRFTGNVPPEVLRAAYAESYAGLLLSRHEGRPRVVIEMQAMRLPVVAADADGTRETFQPGASGFLVPVDDAPAAAAHLNLLLQRPEMGEAFGVKGQEFSLRQYSLQALAERHQNFYLRILGEKRSELRMSNISELDIADIYEEMAADLGLTEKQRALVEEILHSQHPFTFSFRSPNVLLNLIEALFSPRTDKRLVEALLHFKTVYGLDDSLNVDRLEDHVGHIMEYYFLKQMEDWPDAEAYQNGGPFQVEALAMKTRSETGGANPDALIRNVRTRVNLLGEFKSFTGKDKPSVKHVKDLVGHQIDKYSKAILTSTTPALYPPFMFHDAPRGIFLGLGSRLIEDQGTINETRRREVVDNLNTWVRQRVDAVRKKLRRDGIALAPEFQDDGTYPVLEVHFFQQPDLIQDEPEQPNEEYGMNAVQWARVRPRIEAFRDGRYSRIGFHRSDLYAYFKRIDPVFFEDITRDREHGEIRLFQRYHALGANLEERERAVAEGLGIPVRPVLSASGPLRNPRRLEKEISVLTGGLPVMPVEPDVDFSVLPDLEAGLFKITGLGGFPRAAAYEHLSRFIFRLEAYLNRQVPAEKQVSRRTLSALSIALHEGILRGNREDLLQPVYLRWRVDASAGTITLDVFDRGFNLLSRDPRDREPHRLLNFEEEDFPYESQHVLAVPQGGTQSFAVGNHIRFTQSLTEAEAGARTVYRISDFQDESRQAGTLVFPGGILDKEQPGMLFLPPREVSIPKGGGTLAAREQRFIELDLTTFRMKGVRLVSDDRGTVLDRQEYDHATGVPADYFEAISRVVMGLSRLERQQLNEGVLDPRLRRTLHLVGRAYRAVTDSNVVEIGRTGSPEKLKIRFLLQEEPDASPGVLKIILPYRDYDDRPAASGPVFVIQVNTADSAASPVLNIYLRRYNERGDLIQDDVQYPEPGIPVSAADVYEFEDEGGDEAGGFQLSFYDLYDLLDRWYSQLPEEERAGTASRALGILREMLFQLPPLAGDPSDYEEDEFPEDFTDQDADDFLSELRTVETQPPEDAQTLARQLLPAVLSGAAGSVEARLLSTYFEAAGDAASRGLYLERLRLALRSEASTRLKQWLAAGRLFSHIEDSFRSRFPEEDSLIAERGVAVGLDERLVGRSSRAEASLLARESLNGEGLLLLAVRSWSPTVPVSLEVIQNSVRSLGPQTSSRFARVDAGADLSLTRLEVETRQRRFDEGSLVFFTEAGDLHLLPLTEAQKARGLVFVMDPELLREVPADEILKILKRLALAPARLREFYREELGLHPDPESGLVRIGRAFLDRLYDVMAAEALVQAAA